MDLISEASNGPRILTARHLSADTPQPDENIAINATLVCKSYDVQPDFLSYLTVLHPYAWVLWCCGLWAVLVTCVLYAVTLRSALRIWRGHRWSVAVVLSIYPIVGALALVVTVLPRSRVLCEALSQQAVMIALYHFFNLIVAECGGATQLIARSEGARLQTRVLPCCCYPCCILPRPQMDKKSLNWLRYLVLQVPVIQGILFTVILVLRSEDMMLYKNSLPYIQPLVAASILTGVWGVMMTVRAAEALGYRPRRRYVVLQLALVIVKVQCAISKSLPSMVDVPCVMALHPSVFVNLIQYTVTIVEMLLLAVCAWRLYRLTPSKVLDKIPQVVVSALEDSIGPHEKENYNSTIDTRCIAR